MKIIKIDSCLDGGTIKVVTTDEIYCIDSRIKTRTKGSIFLGYPKDDNSNVVSNQEEIKMAIINEFEKHIELKFGNVDWKPRVYELLNVSYHNTVN